jgi:dienelactone hydrolase
VQVPRDRLKLRDSKRISAPTVVAPLYGCATAVVVIGFIPGATLDVEVAGAVVVSGYPTSSPDPEGALVPLPAALVAGDVVRARQRFGVNSGWSNPVTAIDHSVDYPAGPPRPEISPAPVYRCGARTGVANLLIGCNTWITADGVEVGRKDGAAEHQGIDVTPDYGAHQAVVAHAELCGDPAPDSAVEVTQDPPAPLAAPTFDTAYEGSSTVTLNGLANGCRFTLTRNGASVGTFRAWGGRFTIYSLTPPVAAGDSFSATQTLCPGDPPSPPGTTTAQPCSTLPAPVVAPIQAGATSVFLEEYVPDARVKVYVNGVERGDGGGPVVGVSPAVARGDTVDVVQSVGTCTSQWAQELTVACVAPPTVRNPSALDLFPVGNLEYDGGTDNILGTTMHVRGSVYYPADSDGVGVPFNTRLGKLGRVPVVFLVHGRHSASVPNYRGYDYFQTQLARMGFVAVSVDENETVSGGGPTNIRQRAELAISSIRHFQSLDGGGDPIFGGRLDFDRVGLMGHSRGGEAVVVMPEVPPPAGVSVRCVLSLAPVDFGASSGSPRGYALLTILPAADGDVITNPGAHFYDRAEPVPFRSQLYVDHANHNFFNRQWTNDDAGGSLPLMARADHERILSAYGCAFFRHVLLGHATRGHLEGTVAPSGVLTGNVHLSFQPEGTRIVDNHEDGNGIGVNSLGQPTSQTLGLSADEFPFDQVGAPFNGTFFGRTTGMVAQSKGRAGVFRSQLGKPRALRGEIRIRAAEVFTGGPLPAGATGFQLGVETSTGARFWVDSNEVGGVPRPFEREVLGPSKTMPSTLRFPLACLLAGAGRRNQIRAILIKLDRGDGRALAFDDLEIVR